MYRIFSLIIFLAMAAHTGFAAGFPEKMGKINMDSYINLPSPGSLILVKRNGELIVFSGNGRYMMRGAIYDMWNGGKRIHSMAEGKASGRRIRLTNMSNVLEGVASINVGDKHGKQVFVFVDPSSEPSKKTLKMLRGVHGYQIQVILLAAMNKRSADIAKRLMCLKEKSPAQARKIILSGNMSFAPKGECGQEKLMQTLVLSKILGITRVPAIIAPNGEPLFGVPANLNKFLKDNSS